MPATLKTASMTELVVSLARREVHILEVMKEKRNVLIENRKRRRKEDRKLRNLLRIQEAPGILRCKHREKTLPHLKIFTTGSAQVGTDRLAGRTRLENVEVEERGERAGKRSQRSGE